MDGDWNIVLDEWKDRAPSKFSDPHPNSLMYNFRNILHLHDMKVQILDNRQRKNPGSSQTLQLSKG